VDHNEDTQEHDNLLRETKSSSNNRSTKNKGFYFALVVFLIICFIVPDKSIFYYFNKLFMSHDDVKSHRDCDVIASRYTPEDLVGIYRVV
jgi:hypothetical protein